MNLKVETYTHSQEQKNDGISFWTIPFKYAENEAFELEVHSNS